MTTQYGSRKAEDVFASPTFCRSSGPPAPPRLFNQSLLLEVENLRSPHRPKSQSFNVEFSNLELVKEDLVEVFSNQLKTKILKAKDLADGHSPPMPSRRSHCNLLSGPEPTFLAHRRCEFPSAVLQDPTLGSARCLRS